MKTRTRLFRMSEDSPALYAGNQGQSQPKWPTAAINLKLVRSYGGEGRGQHE
jgi:hypothetical protein